ncbi:MAG: glycosyltransferase family 4 protein [Spirochaetales bacterium]|nr:glycosyltransferase family 4 protein [Spirochaetales bacterium]
MTLIAIYISKNYRTGGQKRYLEVLIGLAQRNHTVHLFHREERDFPFDLPSNIILHPLEVENSYSQQRAFTKALKNLNLEELKSINANKILLFGESSLSCGIYLKRVLNIPLIVALRNNNYVANRITRNKSPKNIISDLRNRYRELQLTLNVDHLVFQSAFDRDSVCSRNGFKKSRTILIPNSVKASWFLDEWRGKNQSNELKKILFVGSDDKRKGFFILLKALKEMRAKGHKFSLTLIGDFPRTDITELPDWVDFKGRIDTPLETLSKGDLLIAPSLYDSFPNTVLESLFVGTPVIGTDVAGIKTMLHHEELLFRGGSVEDLCRCLEPLFDTVNYQEAKGLCNERLTHFDFDWIEPWEKLLIEP